MKELSTVHFQSCLISLSERSPGTLARHLRSILLHLGCFITLLWWGGDGGSEVQCSCAWSQHSYCSSAESGWLLPLSAESCAGVPKHPNAADCGQAWKSSRCVQREAWELVPLVWCRPVYTGEPVLQGISRIPCAVLLCLGYSPFLLHQRTAEVKKFLLCGWYILTQLFLGWLYWVIKQEHLPQIVRGTRVRSWRLWNFKYKVLLIFVVHVKSLHTVPQAIDFYGFKLYRIPLRARNLLCFFKALRKDMQVADSRGWKMKENHSTTSWWTMSVCRTILSPCWQSPCTSEIPSTQPLHHGICCTKLPFSPLQIQGRGGHSSHLCSHDIWTEFVLFIHQGHVFCRV